MSRFANLARKALPFINQPRRTREIDAAALARASMLAAFNGPAITNTADLAAFAAQANEAFEAQKRAFEEFKAAVNDNDKKRDVVTDDKIAKINNAMTDAQKQMEEAKKAIDTIAAGMARITVGGSGANDNAALEKHARAFMQTKLLAEGRKHDDVARALESGVDVKAYQDYCAAFIELVVNQANPARVPTRFQAAMEVGKDPSGGYLVPAELAAGLRTRLFDTSPMRSIASVATVGVDIWEQINDTGDGITGGWVGEKSARSATETPALGVKEIRVHEQYAYPQLTQKMLEDAVRVNAADWLTSKTTNKMVRVENTAFVSGNGIAKPFGFLSYAGAATTQGDSARAWGKLQYIPVGASGAFPVISGKTAANPNALIDIIYAVKSAYRLNANWAMNRMTVAAVRKLKDDQGNFLWQPGLQAGQPSMLNGYGIAELDDMPDIGADSFSIAFGDFREGYQIIDRLGFSVIVDDVTNKPYVGFYIRRRVGGDVVNFDAIKLLKFAAT